MIDSIATGVPAALKEIRKLVRALKLRARRRARLLRPARHIQRAHRGDSTGGSNTSAAPHPGSATSRITSLGPCFTAATPIGYVRTASDNDVDLGPIAVPSAAGPVTNVPVESKRVDHGWKSEALTIDGKFGRDTSPPSRSSS